MIEETTGQGKHYAEWEAERTGKETVRGLIRRDIDAAIRESFTFESFLTALRRQGYSIKYGPNVKHTAICPPGGQRFFRLSGMGERYTEAAIRERLAAIRRGDREDLPVQIIEPPKRYTIRRGYLTQMPRKKCGVPGLVCFLSLSFEHTTTQEETNPLFHTGGGFQIYGVISGNSDCCRNTALIAAHSFPMLTDALQAQIDGLTEQRKERYQEKREGREVTAEIQSINQELRRVRSKLKLCKQIKVDMSHIQTQMEEYQTNIRREQEERHQRKSHAATDKGRPDRHFDPVR